MMYFSKIQVLPEALRIRETKRALLDEYGPHRLVWLAFDYDGDASRDFVFRAEEGGGFPLLYVVSKREPITAGGAFRVQTKPYDPKVGEGERLRFQLRANPIVQRAVDGSRRSKKHDVVMDLKHTYRNGDGETPPQPEIVRKAAVPWLASKAQRHGFEIVPEQVRADSYRQHRLRKHRKAKPIRYSTVDFEGTLTVTDVDAFRESLFEGVGAAKGFGCGLLMVRRA